MAIKTQPEDFVVEEELDPAYLNGVLTRTGPFALYSVRKRLLTTHELLDRLAGRLKIPLSALAAAGLKDKQAVTTQHVTLRVDFDLRRPPESLQGESFSANLLGFVSEPIDSHAILRNRFQIVVRVRKPSAILEMREASRRYESFAPRQRGDGRTLLVANYFGNQRFGSARAGKGFVAAHLVRGEFEKALRLAIATPHRKDERRVKAFKQRVADAWEARDWAGVLRTSHRLPECASIEHLQRKPDDFRGAFAALPYFFQQLCVEAHQSLLWNRIAAALLIDRLGESGRLWVVDDTFNQLVFPEAGAVPADLSEVVIPLLGRKTDLAEPWKHAAERVLEEERLDGPSALRIPGMDKPWFGESPRPLFMRAEDFELKKSDAGATVRFALPRGGYATVLLRALGQ